MPFEKGHKGFSKKDDPEKVGETKVKAPENGIGEAAKSAEPGVPTPPEVPKPEDEDKKALEAKLAEAQAKIAELEKAAASAKLIDEPDPNFHILLHTRFKGDHVKLVNGKTVEFVNGYAKIPRSDTTTYELMKRSKLWGSEYIEVNKMAVVSAGPGVQIGPLSTLRGTPKGGNQ